MGLRALGLSTGSRSLGLKSSGLSRGQRARPPVPRTALPALLPDKAHGTSGFSTSVLRPPCHSSTPSIKPGSVLNGHGRAEGSFRCLCCV